MKLAIILHCSWGQASPPSRGAWIEIMIRFCVISVSTVAPLAGGVD